MTPSKGLQPKGEMCPLLVTFFFPDFSCMHGRICVNGRFAPADNLSGTKFGVSTVYFLPLPFKLYQISFHVDRKSCPIYC